MRRPGAGLAVEVGGGRAGPLGRRSGRQTMDQELQYGVRTRRQVQQQQKMETKPSSKASAPRKKSRGGAKGHGKRAGPAYRGATPPLPDSPSEIAEDDQSTADSPGCLATTTSHARVGWPSPPQEDAVPPAAEVGGERLAAVPEAQLTGE